jgi:glycosyltransferase involved in cell wall biosynthesis
VDPVRSSPEPVRLPGISIVVPAHNEAGNVGRAVASLRAAAAASADEVEVIVVDDGSTDATAAEAAGAGAQLVRHAANRGYGGAVRSGLEAVTLPWTWLVDADNQFDPAELTTLVARAAEADLVLGFRPHRAEGLRRAVAARAWRGLAEGVLGPLTVDVDCAFKLMRTDVLRRLRLTSEGAAVSAELVARARRAGATVVEVPVTHLPRTIGSPSGLKPAVIARAFRELWRLRRELAEPSRRAGA